MDDSDGKHPKHYADDPRGALGVPPDELSNDDLLRELNSLHRTRDDTLRHGPDDALAQHNRRTAELEAEYLRRNPDREIARGTEALGDPDDTDFAEEHASPTFADEPVGGPERVAEQESPRGLAGMDEPRHPRIT
jgi:Family of unknown function (DUF6158)